MRLRCIASVHVLLAVVPFPCAMAQDATAKPELRVLPHGDHGREVRIGDASFVVLRTEDDPAAPLCYPILGPGGVAMMRRFPFEDVKGEPQDHPHHRSLWFAHGDVNGLDFWTAKHGGPSIRCDGFVALDGPASRDTILLRDTWLDPEGKAVCSDERRLHFSCAQDDAWRAIDHAITIHANAGELRFGDTKEGTFAFRMAPGLALSGKGAHGRLIDSEGHKGADVWGKRARWIAYDGEVEGKRVGFAMFDHPQNPRFPTWWHARDYGLAAANPFGQHDFEGSKGKPGDFVLAADGELTLRHRIVFFRGDADREAIEHWFEEFAHATDAVPAAAGKQEKSK